MRLLSLIALTALFLGSCSKPSGHPTEPLQSGSAPPTEWSGWAQWADKLSPVDDGKGHGPDVGSDEWARALDRKLGVSDQAGHGPDLKSSEWRQAVERKLTQ
jgi:hypothetical protein